MVVQDANIGPIAQCTSDECYPEATALVCPVSFAVDGLRYGLVSHSLVIEVENVLHDRGRSLILHWPADGSGTLMGFLLLYNFSSVTVRRAEYEMAVAVYQVMRAAGQVEHLLGLTAHMKYDRSPI